jgi:tetratricopeptide (TPR) repeat protein
MDGKTLLAVVVVAVAMVGFIVFLTNNPTWDATRPDLEALRTASDGAKNDTPVPRRPRTQPQSTDANTDKQAATTESDSHNVSDGKPKTADNTNDQAANLNATESTQAKGAAPLSAIAGKPSEAVAGPKDTTQPARPKTEDFRLWTANTGYQVEAQYVSRAAETITLKRRDGKVINVAVSLLSELDLDYLKNIASGTTDNRSPIANQNSTPDIAPTKSTPPAEKVTAANVEQLASRCPTAKKALSVYEAFLADSAVPDESKQVAKKRLEHWQSLAAKDFVRLGVLWVSPDDATSAHAEASQFLDQAFHALAAQRDTEARQKLEKASHADPNSTYAEFLLGMIYGLGDRNYKKAQNNLSECARRDPDDVAALNNLAIISVVGNDHASALKNFQAALAINPAAAEVIHNIRRVLDLSTKKMLIVSAGNTSTYKSLCDRTEHPDTSALDRAGWIYSSDL